MSFEVSILIPCYNAEKWIAKAIDSALEQTYKNKKIIVIDDGSTDNSLDIIKSFDGYIKWETQINRGGNFTRNRLLELSTGDWLQYLDADDYLLPNKIEKQVQFLSSNPDCDLVYSQVIAEYYNDNKVRQENTSIPQPHDPWILLAKYYLPQTGGPLWRKQAIIDVGYWKVDQPCCQEYELYLRLLQENKSFCYFDFPSYVYRQWSESTVCKKNPLETINQKLKLFDKAEKHLEQTQQLTIQRKKEIAQARFRCARLIWLFDRKWAMKIINCIENSNRNFIPSDDIVPKLYQKIYKIFGFNTTEKIARIKRDLFKNQSG